MQRPNTYDTERRYIFNNWSSEDFVGVWGGTETLVKSGDSIEVPEFKAFHFMKHLVDREMTKEGITALDSEDLRKPYEEKTCTGITGDVDSPALSSLKQKIKEEVKKEESGEMKSGDVNHEDSEEKGEFADIKETPKKVTKKNTSKKK